MKQRFSFAASAELNIRDAVIDALGRAQLSLGATLIPHLVVMHLSGLHGDNANAHKVLWQALSGHWQGNSTSIVALSMIASQQLVGGGYVSVSMAHLPDTKVIPVTSLQDVKSATQGMVDPNLILYMDAAKAVTQHGSLAGLQTALYEATGHSPVRAFGGLLAPSPMACSSVESPESGVIGCVLSGGGVVMDTVVTPPTPIADTQVSCAITDSKPSEGSLLSLDGTPALERLQTLFPKNPGEVYVKFEGSHTQHVTARRGDPALHLLPPPKSHEHYLEKGKTATFFVPHD
eukprot:PhF_6_TR21677/c0_g1_i2/m.30942